MTEHDNNGTYRGSEFDLLTEESRPWKGETERKRVAVYELVGDARVRTQTDLELTDEDLHTETE